MYINTVPLLAWVPWVPENPTSFEHWVPEPINFEKKELNFITLVQSEQEIGVRVWDLEFGNQSILLVPFGDTAK